MWDKKPSTRRKRYVLLGVAVNIKGGIPMYKPKSNRDCSKFGIISCDEIRADTLNFVTFVTKLDYFDRSLAWRIWWRRQNFRFEKFIVQYK